MIWLIAYTLAGGLFGAIGGYLLAEGLPEGAFVGAMLGACLGLLVAVRKGAGSASASFEYEAAGIHDSNLTTIARRNLVREAYRDSLTPQFHEEKIESLGGAQDPKRK